ncbi:hypothetical protein [Lactiplantibacillus xiangfangensis]|uniref:RNase H type-1 domain-containing protein n=1 Tax=Lactiplantibacillus xiangfangensis TaxID=942150 RepID=A0A0R2MC33_9LACO|nr:hypothetical protein [Lactiplantibacillus xiangfangensis]KRO10983.1 hypothetical protein IV64_GL002679 [Lactiplantibacillus xiangfangensis]
MTTIQMYLVTEVVTKSPKKGAPAAAWAAVLTYRDQQKVLTAGQYTLTSNAILLTALISSLKALKRHDLPIIVSLPAGDVLTAFNQQTYVVWRQNGWKTDDHPIANQQLWETLITLTDRFPDLTLTEHSAHSSKNASLATTALQKTLATL